MYSSEYISLYLSPINGSVNVQVIRKNIKNVHLKVFRTMDVVLSVPLLVPSDWIEDFLHKRIKWIDNQVTMYKLSDGNNTLNSIKSGTSVQVLGKDMRVLIIPSIDNSIEMNEKQIVFYTNKADDDEQIQKVFIKWWRDNASTVFQEETDRLFEKIFKKYEISKPDISIRKMKTLWGSCTPTKSKITLNEYLLKANIRCIQYVILHELTHLLYPNHSKQFYDFLTIQMPDWQERKKQLDTEVVQGL